MNIKDFFNQHPVFRYEEFSDFMRENGTTQTNAIHRLLGYYRAQDKLIPIRRLLYAVNPDMILNQREIDPYLIAAKATQNAVLAYHTALEIHNLAYTTFEELTYLTTLPSRGFSFQNQHYRPVSYPKALTIQKKELFGVDTIKRNGLDIKVTSLERTLVDILDRPDLSGGWEEIIRSLDHIVTFDAQKIVDYTLLLSKGGVTAKVGYFFEQLPKHLAIDQKYLSQLSANLPKQPYYIDSNRNGKNQGIYIKKWQLIIPKHIAERQWEEPSGDF
ncbi:MAG: hypothetical protein A2X78_04145 [Gammaproteobacteria bacterium GWE2_37_16]|nr:MAG: hypothetical protein A2X78_04145 [Gammaproteobacteria bacterium GWE2_37_16]